MNRILLFVFVGVLSIGHGLAQKNKNATPASVGVSNTGTGTVYYGNRSEPPRAIEFKKGAVSTASFLTNINSYFNIPAEFTFRETEANTDNLGMRHRHLQQYYNGLLVEGMGYKVHEKDGFVTSANGRAVRKINLDTHVVLGEEQAFRLAVQYLQTKDTTVRIGKKLIVSKDFTLAPESFSIAYQFDIDVSLIERWRVSIDARDGKLVNKVSLVNSCHTEEEKDEVPPPPFGTGIGKTNYYGTQTIRVDKNGSGSRLVGQTEHGGSIGTYDFRNGPIIILLLGFPYDVSEFYSSNNTYYYDYQKPAVSAQWAAEQAYEYYYQKHNRNSFDNHGGKITTYVHVDVGLDNAFWTGTLLALGDGSNNNPLVELDVVAHELTHGVTQYEAKLQYSYESGALNESFSDILAKAAEFSIFGDTATWQMGRHFRPGGLRDFSNPNLKNQPDTYAGDMWYTGYEDGGGVHTNSGVQNFWFYLLSKGGSGVNDNGFSYSVNAIGIDAAAKIAYRNLTEYLSVESDYLDSRIGSLLATADLYGKNSTTYQQVDKAWDAVGVIDEPIITSLELYDITGTTVKVKGSLLPRGNAVTYRFEYGTTLAYGSSTAPSAYTDKVEGIVTGLQSKTKYYLRLVATNENGSSDATTEFTTIALAPLVKIKQTADISETTASLYGEVNPNSLPTSFYFEYGLTPAFGSVTPSSPLPAATEYQNISAAITNLQPRKTYYFRLVATNGFATSVSESSSFFTAVKPVITSYAPMVAQIGTEVTITGLNFNPVAQKNLVSFGATRGTVLSASATTLKVNVPAGASFGPINVMDAESGLSAQSIQEFVPTFTGEFKKGNLQLRFGSTDYIYQTLVQDMDGDNKPDLVARHYLGFSVFQNVNQGGDITDQSFVRNTFNAESSPDQAALVDMDGNGLKDVVARYGNQLRVYPNYSVPGFIFFGTPVILPVGDFFDLTFNDFDDDGRPDIALTEYVSSELVLVKIFRNQNPKGFILPENFVNQFSVQLPYYAYRISSNDFNNDGKPDLLVGAYDRTFLPILKNNSHPGVIAFDENQISGVAPVRYYQHFSNDLNQDGWKDIISNNPDLEGTMGILENKGTTPTITMKTTDFTFSGYAASVIRPSDVNGDGIVDLMVGLNNGKFVLLKNKVGKGPITKSSFEKFEEYGAVNADVYRQSDLTVSDLNGDGRPDIINTFSYNRFPHEGFQMEIWQNSPNACPDASLITLSVSNTSATLTLPPNTTRDQFIIDYSASGGAYWSTVPGTTLSYLNPGYAYKIRARAKCYLGFTEYSYLDFQTECVNISSFSIGSIGIDQVEISATNFYSFEVQYSPAGQNQWIYQYYNTITNLLPGTAYDLRFRGQCVIPGEFNYMQFTTLCPKLSTLAVTNIVYNKAVANWTSNYTGNAILEYSADNVTWTLADATQTMYPLIPGKQYKVRATLACTDSNADFIYATFTTPCPQVSTVYVDAATPFSATIKWTDESSTGRYTVTYTAAPGGTITTVETSSTSLPLNGLSPGTQYAVTVTPQCVGAGLYRSTQFSTPCFVPLELSVEDITHTTAQLSWTDNFGGVPYSIDYSIAGSKVWVTVQTTATTLSLTKLRPGTDYEVRVHITCTSQTAPYVSRHFKTELYEETTFFPNPTDREITIQPSKDLIGNRFMIFDYMGRIVASGELPDYTIDMSGWASGVYTLKIEDEKPLKIVKR